MVLLAFLMITAFQREVPKPFISDIVVNRLNYEQETVLAEVTVRVAHSCQKLQKVGRRYDQDRGVVLLYPRMAPLSENCSATSASAPTSANDATSGTTTRPTGKAEGAHAAFETQFVTEWIPLGRFSEGRYEIRDLKSLRVLEAFEIAKGPSLGQELVTLLKHR